MRTQGQPARGHDAGHVRVGEPTGDVVDHAGAGLDRGRGHGRPGGVDADRHAGRGQLADHRHHPPGLRRRVDAVGARSGRLAAHIDEIGPLGAHPETVGERGIEIRVAPAVGEAVRGHVEHPHHYGRTAGPG